MRKVCILFVGRSGSSHLISLLNSRSDVLIAPEITVAQNESSFATTMQHLYSHFDLTQLQNSCKYKNWKKYFPSETPEHKNIKNLKLIGYKTKVYDIPCKNQFMELVARESISIIKLTRRELFSGVISMIRGDMLHDKFKVYNAQSKNQILGPVRIDIQEFLKRYRNRKNAVGKLDAFCDKFDNIISIDYDDLISEQDTVLKKIENKFNLNRFKYTSSFHKNTQNIYRDVINIDELLKLHEKIKQTGSDEIL